MPRIDLCYTLVVIDALNELLLSLYFSVSWLHFSYNVLAIIIIIIKINRYIVGMHNDD